MFVFLLINNRLNSDLKASQKQSPAKISPTFILNHRTSLVLFSLSFYPGFHSVLMVQYSPTNVPTCLDDKKSP